MRGGILALVGIVAIALATVLVIWLVRVPDMYEIEGYGDVEYTPDEAVITASMYAENDVSRGAAQEVAGGMREILAALKKIGVASNDIKTAVVRSGLLDSYEARKRAEEDKRTYYAEQAVVIKVRDIKTIGKILDASSAAGSNYWAVKYTVSNPDKLAADARKAALANAIATADAYARAGSFQRGRILKIQDEVVEFPQIDYADREYKTRHDRRPSSGIEKVTVTGTRSKEIPDNTFDIPPPREQTASTTTHVLFEIE